jgi:hypothetical protein
MRLKKYLSEEYLGTVETDYSGMEGGFLFAHVYKNPSRREIAELDVNEIRFTVDNKKKDIYAWEAERAFHGDVFDWHFGTTEKFENYRRFFYGVAKKRGGKWVCTESDEFSGGRFSTEFLEDLKNRIKWVDNKILVTPYIDKLIKYNKDRGL